jgi:hypothetical protein
MTLVSPLRIENNALSGTLLFNGKPLVNATSYNPNTSANSGVAYSGAGGLPANDSEGKISAMVAALKASYAATPDVASNSSIANLLSTTGSVAGYRRLGP